MLDIPISAVPNQMFSVTIEDTEWDFSIYVISAQYDDFGNALNVIMGADITANNVPILSGLRLVAGYPVIPYLYLENGNFVFVTMNDDYPDYQEFGVTQSLVYASLEELADLRAGN